MKVAVVSSVYGGHDEPYAPPQQDTPVSDWVMVTGGEMWPEPWRTVVEPRPQLPPRLAAKVAKCRPDLYTSADVFVWIDGNIRVTSAGFVSWCLERLGDADMAQWRTPGTIAEEGADAANVARWPKYTGQPIGAQVAHYMASGHPAGYPKWWTGLIVRRDTARLAAFGDAWLLEMTRWSFEDQLSEPVAARRLGLRVNDIPDVWSGGFDRAAHRDDS